ncbi:hypothetical protein Bccel_2880 [Pseudobacteroides cellulosolvens ATCC 35603 = DSM 2933]|uniref:Uncharacterized protein n=1 Tax=Pseudobacteroides cellulosolvens ATCC 35603 = DSM 2933 TaxID=398512 RepID=A0A0L6JPA2_9FIRM|nr:hypothetical protein Bccel_2880 [Pseudobacteroides cellulosolvens ATCC 35603 = DSM 2933]
MRLQLQIEESYNFTKENDVTNYIAVFWGGVKIKQRFGGVKWPRALLRKINIDQAHFRFQKSYTWYIIFVYSFKQIYRSDNNE